MGREEPRGWKYEWLNKGKILYVWLKKSYKFP